jgi:hypothetical protein
MLQPEDKNQGLKPSFYELGMDPHPLEHYFPNIPSPTQNQDPGPKQVPAYSLQHVKTPK